MLNLPIRASVGTSASTPTPTPTLINLDADTPPPRELGLPDKFTAWRTQQLDAINRIILSDKRFITICMPTGGGKSLVAMGAAIMSGRRTVMLTSTKGLQDQVSADFSSVIADIRGMSNYACPITQQLGIPEGTTVNDAPCQCGYRCILRGRGLMTPTGCAYFDRYRLAQRADTVITNYQCWMYDSLKDQSGESDPQNLQFGFATKDDRPVSLLIMDEVHDAAEEIGRFIGIDISRKECLALHLPWPDAGTTIDDWREWASELMEPVTDRIKTFEAQLRNQGGKHEHNQGNRRGGQWSRELKHLRDIKRRLDRLAGMDIADDWVITEADKNTASGTMTAVRFDPLIPARYAESALFRGIDKIVLVSATVRPKTAVMLGITREDMEFIEYPSTFAIERRPVIHVPSIRVTYHTEQNDELMREWLQVFDDIVEPRLGLEWKGIVHCVSYRRAKFILDNSRNKALMLTHSSYNRAQAIEQFKRLPGPRVLLSPSVDTGYDFPGDLCRFQIIVKLPFSSVTDPVVKARKLKDPDYDLYQVAQTIVQMSGRAVRSESDWAETWILDDSLSWALPKMKAKGFLPKWWMDGFRSVEVAPGPLVME